MAKQTRTEEVLNEKDKQVVDMVHDMYNRSANTKSKYVSKWKDFIGAYTGEYLKSKLPDYKSDNVCNYIFSTLETIRPIMVSENPKFQVMPRLEKDFSKSFKVQQALDYEWARTKMSLMIPKVILPVLQIGTGIIFLPWNKKDGKIGDVKPTIVSAFNFFPDPNALTIEDAEWVIYATYKNVGEIIKMFPEKSEELRKSASTPNQLDLVVGQDSSNMSNNQILVYEVYMKDWSTEKTIQEEEDGNKYEVVKLKYPKGRRIQVAGDVLLSDGSNVYADGKFPFVVFKCYDLPDQFWGMGEVEQLISPNKNVNTLINQVLDNARMTANAQWVMDKNCGVDTKQLTNRPGLIVKKNPGTEVRREDPPSLPAYVQNIIEVLKRDIEVISGVFDVTRGEKPAGITAGVAINQLTESAQSRIKLKMQLLEYGLSELGSMWVSRIIQFWTLPRQLRIMVSSQDLQQMQPNQNNSANDLNIVNPNASMSIGQTNVPIFTSLSGDEIDGDWDITVIGGSTMPVNKNARLQQYIQLAQTPAEDGLPMIDRKTVLMQSEIPNVEEVLARFEEHKKDQEAQQQAQLESQAQVQAAQSQHQSDLNLQNQMAQQMMQGKGQGQGEMPTQDDSQNQESPEEQLIQQLSELEPEVLLKILKANPQLEQIIEQLWNNPLGTPIEQGGM